MRLLPQSPPPGGLSRLAHWSRALLAVSFAAIGTASQLVAQTYFDLSTSNYLEDFTSISTWSTPSTGSWTGLAAGGTAAIPDATKITASSATAFTTTTSGGVQKGTNNLYLLSTGATSNTTSAAIDLNLNFTGRTTGNLSFDAATVFNNTGDRGGSLKVYFSLNGTTWTEITGTNLPYVATNNVAGSVTINVPIPAAVDGQSQVKLRFYYHNAPTGTNGSRPKISIDNVAVTSSAGVASPTISTTGTPTAFSTIEGTASASQSFTVAGSTLTADVSVAAPTNFEVSTDNIIFSSSVSIPQTAGSATGTVYTRITASAAVGSVSGNITLSSTGATNKTVAVSGTVTSAAAPVLTATPTSLTGFTTSAGVFSASQTFSVSGTNLGTNNLTVTAPTGYEVATTGGYSSSVSLVPSAGSVSSITISVRISAAAAAGAATGNVVVASTGATSVNVSVSGTVTAAVVINYISITAPASPYTQNFDGLPATTSIASAFSATVGLQASLSGVTGSPTLDGWYATKNSGTGTGASALNVDAGSNNAGGIYSYGAASSGPDRALGAVASAGNLMTFGALVKNNTGAALTGLTFTFTGEFWRSSTVAQNVLPFAYGKIDGTTFTNSNFLTAAGATTASSLDIAGPPPIADNTGALGALDGNLPANRAQVTSITIPISLASGEVAFIRWTDSNETGNDAGLAIDDLTLVGENSTVLTPVVSVAGGAYYTDQTVFVSNFASYVAGETLRYTTDGSDPTAASPAYNNTTGIPIAIGAGNKTLKIAAFPTSGSRSNIATILYQLPQDVANLTALRVFTAGTQIYRVTGQITFTASYASRNTKFFQDSGAGIQVDDAAGTVTNSYIAGDNIQNAIGTLSTFNGQLQFVPKVNFGPALTSGNPVVAVSRTLTTLADADQGRLVTITGVTFTSAGTGFGTAPSFTNISDGTTGVLQNAFGGGFDTATIPSGTNTVTGIVQRTLAPSVQTLTVAPRNLADIVFTGLQTLTLTPNKTTLLEGITGDPDEAAVEITRTGSTAAALTVDLSVSPLAQLMVDLAETVNPLGYRALPTTVTIPIGQVSTTVYLIPTNDAVFTGNRTATFSAAAAGFTTANQVFNITEDDAAGNTYASWIGGFNVETKTAGGDDFDGDGIGNALENYMGSDPSVSNTGLTAVSGTATSITFRHNRADFPASDVSATYEWSVDLVNWFPSGAGAGITVTITAPTVITPGSPNDLVEVTASVTTGSATKLFARLKGVKAP